MRGENQMEALIRLGVLMMILSVVVLSEPLSPNFYEKTCPQALPTINHVVQQALHQEKRMGASLLRLHFHDCFVNGCDGSILLDSTPQFVSEKLAAPNNNSVRGFEVVDRIKLAVDEACGAPVVSCADILAVAARDSVVGLGGQGWEVLLGRRDSTFADINAANNDIPPPFLDLPQLIANFQNQGLDVNDLVVLSGGHTLGLAQCISFRSHIYNDSNIDPEFRRQLQAICPPQGGGGDANLFPLDPTPALTDTKYFGNIIGGRGLLHSDQELLNSSQTRNLVSAFSYNNEAFARAFAVSMVKMGNIKPLTGDQGQIRRYNCRTVVN